MVDRRLLIVCLAMIGSTVSWRAGVYYSGGADPVVVFKALLSVVALLLARHSMHVAGPRNVIGTRSFWLLGLYLTCSVFGAWWYGNLFASTVLAVRVLILATTVFYLVRTYARQAVFEMMTLAMAVFAVVGAVTWLLDKAAGAGPIGFVPRVVSLLAQSRLHGGVPPLTSNELAFLCSVTFLMLLWRALHGFTMRGQAALMVVFLLMVWFTGSRTGLVALIVATAVILVQVRRWPVPAFVAGVITIPVAFYLVVGLGLLSKFLDRGGSANVNNLSNRTVAWSAASHLYDERWGVVFGSGLSVKQIPVAGQWWNTQILDSSWVSALVQAGLAGLIVMGLWVLWAVVGAFLVARPERLLVSGLLVYMVIRSILESGLLDATPAFCLFFAISLLGEQRSRDAVRSAGRTTPAGAELASTRLDPVG